MTISMKEISKLSVAQRIVLAEKIWDSIPENSEELFLTKAQNNELNKRLDALESGTAKTVSWNQVKNKLRIRKK